MKGEPYTTPKTLSKTRPYLGILHKIDLGTCMNRNFRECFCNLSTFKHQTWRRLRRSRGQISQVQIFVSISLVRPSSIGNTVRGIIVFYNIKAGVFKCDG